jgi:hypothetical protein
MTCPGVLFLIKYCGISEKKNHCGALTFYNDIVISHILNDSFACKRFCRSEINRTFGMVCGTSAFLSYLVCQEFLVSHFATPLLKSYLHKHFDSLLQIIFIKGWIPLKHRSS